MFLNGNPFWLPDGLSPGGAGGSGPSGQGEPFPALMLPDPKSAEDKNYLGLSGTGAFKISQVKGQAVLIEIFSMYCPIARRTLPGSTNCSRPSKGSELKGRIKIIGIGLETPLTR